MRIQTGKDVGGNRQLQQTGNVALEVSSFMQSRHERRRGATNKSKEGRPGRTGGNKRTATAIAGKEKAAEDGKRRTDAPSRVTEQEPIIQIRPKGRGENGSTREGTKTGQSGEGLGQRKGRTQVAEEPVQGAEKHREGRVRQKRTRQGPGQKEVSTGRARGQQDSKTQEQ